MTTRPSRRVKTCSSSPVLAGLLLGERLEPPFDLCDPALQLRHLTGRRPEFLDNRVGQALELPLERRQQAHPPGVQILHRPLRPPLHIRTQLSNVDQRENLVNHRLAAAFDQPARVVAQLADQPLPQPLQPPDGSTNAVQREQPCLCLLHEPSSLLRITRPSWPAQPRQWHAGVDREKGGDPPGERAGTRPPAGWTPNRKCPRRPARPGGQSPLRGPPRRSIVPVLLLVPSAPAC